MQRRVRELRVVVTANDYDEALHFYRDVLGLKEQAAFGSKAGHVAILQAGRATLELVDQSHAEFVDQQEVGHRVAGQIRVAFQVDDSAELTRVLESAGAHVIAEPTKTPWNSLNARLQGPADLQLTIFTELGLTHLSSKDSRSEMSHFTTGDGCSIAYRLDGPPENPVLVLSNSIATELEMWDGQVEELSKYFRVLRYDLRGHGGTGVPSGSYSIDRLGRDVLELLDALGIERVHFCGLSLGGMIGQWLGIHRPERIDRLILCNTSAYLGPANYFDANIASVLAANDMSEVAEMFLHNWFPAGWLDSENPIIHPFRAALLGIDPRGLAGCYAAVRDMDMRRTVALIQSPTLVVGGHYDTVTLPAHSEDIAATIPGAKLLLLPCVHLSNVEYPIEFLQAVLDFLRGDHVPLTE
jgi:3-oxoadipate enol-lactonase